MAESTLSQAFADLQKSVGELLGFGVTPANWDTAQTDIVERMIQAGLRRFYKEYDWRFLEIMGEISTNAQYSTGTVVYDHTGGANERQVTLTTGTWPSWVANGRLTFDGSKYDVDTRVSDTIITLTANSNPGADVAAGTTYKISQEDYDLDDAFGWLTGSVTYGPNDAYRPIRMVGANTLREIRSQEGVSETGPPVMCAVRPKAVDLTNGQRYELMLSPSPDAAYVLQFSYRVQHDKLDATNKYALGGMTHGSTIEAACLLEASLRQNDDAGPWKQEYHDHLEASVRYDREAFSPEFYGYNGDASDSKALGMKPYPRTQIVTYKGVQYGG